MYAYNKNMLVTEMLFTNLPALSWASTFAEFSKSKDAILAIPWADVIDVELVAPTGTEEADQGLKNNHKEYDEKWLLYVKLCISLIQVFNNMFSNWKRTSPTSKCSIPILHSIPTWWQHYQNVCKQDFSSWSQSTSFELAPITILLIAILKKKVKCSLTCKKQSDVMGSHVHCVLQHWLLLHSWSKTLQKIHHLGLWPCVTNTAHRYLPCSHHSHDQQES